MVSVVMSVFNGERFLREAVESILDQSFHELEFIVVDDGSTDRSATILDYYQQADARVKVYHEVHRGLIESLNRGCSLAGGKYIARMDADDVASKDRLMMQVDFMEAHPQIGVLGGAVEWIDATGKSLGIHMHPVEDREIKPALLHRCVLWHPTVVLRREAFVWAGGYRSIFVDAEDCDLWLRIAEHFQLANLEAVVLKYRIHPYQVSMRKRRQQAICSLAAQAAAISRRNGNPDPLNGVKEITPVVLAALGVTEAKQQATLASDWGWWIQSLFAAGQDDMALKSALEMLRFDWHYAERRQISNVHLIVARLYWRRKRFLSSFLATGRAVLMRPVVAGRPLRSALRRLELV
jgi:hypothetical protein